jgi:predicted ATPase
MPLVTIVLSEHTAFAELHGASIASESTCVVVYPETRVHPAHQFRAIVPHLKQATSQRPLIILTHSEAIVNACGELVEAGAFAPDDIDVRIADENGHRSFKFDGKGFLQDWPIGWFFASDTLAIFESETGQESGASNTPKAAS